MLPLDEALRRFDCAYFDTLMHQTRGNVSRTAIIAGRDRTGLYLTLRSLGIDPRRYRPRQMRKKPFSLHALWRFDHGDSCSFPRGRRRQKLFNHQSE